MFSVGRDFFAFFFFFERTRPAASTRPPCLNYLSIRVSEAVPLNHVEPGFYVMRFSDATEKFWGSCINQVPTVDLGGSVENVDMAQEPLGFPSVSFRGSQERWATVDKEGFEVVNTFKRLPYLL